MNVSIEEISSIKRKMVVELPGEEAARTREKHLGQLMGRASIKGFRPGKAPRGLVAKAYADHLGQAVTEELISANLPKALEEQHLELAGMPVLEKVDQGDDRFRFEVSFEIMPSFEAPEWRGLALTREKYEITDEDVERRLAELRRRLSTVAVVEEDRELRAEGDLAEVEFHAFENDQPVEGLQDGRTQVEMGQGQAAPEFEKALVGMKKGETRDISMSFPADAPDKKVAGKSLVMKTTLTGLKTRELPALDDELAKDMAIEGVDTLAALRDRLRADLAAAAEAKVNRDFNRQLTDQLSALAPIEVPEVMVERETRTMTASLNQNFRRGGVDLRQLGIDEARLLEDCRPRAVVSVRAALVLDKIAKENNIDCTDEEVDRELERRAGEYGQPVEVVRQFHEKNDLLTSLRHSLKMEKTLQLITEQARVTEVEPAAEPAGEKPAESAD